MFSFLLMMFLLFAVGAVVKLDAPKFFGGKLYRPDRNGQADVPDAFASKLQKSAPAASQQQPGAGASQAGAKEPKSAPPGTPPGGGQAATGAATELPEDFPARATLLERGLTTLEAVRSTPDSVIVAIKGIGETTLAQIRKASTGASAGAEAPAGETGQTRAGKEGG